MGKTREVLGLLGLLGVMAWSEAAAPPRPVQAGLTEKERKELERQVGALDDQASQLYQQGRGKEALVLARKRLRICERLYPATDYPNGHADLALNLNIIGFLLQSLGESGQALAFFEKALAMHEKLYPPERFKDGHPDLATSLNNMGSALWSQGQSAKALPFFEKVLAMRQKLYPPERFKDGHPAVGLSLNNMGAVLQSLGQPTEALTYHEKALAMREKLYPPERFKDGHSDLAASLTNMGAVLEALGEPSKALPFHERALAMKLKLYPPGRFKHGHPHLALTLNNMGFVLKSLGESGKALSYFEKALAMYQKMYPPERFRDGHPDLANSLNNMGSVMWSLGEFGKALSYFEKALTMYQRLYPPDRFNNGHPELARSLSDMGSVLKSLGESGKALSYFEKALAMYQKLYPPERFKDGHPDLALSLNNMGFVLQSLGEFGKALPFYEKALAMRQTLYPAARFKDGHADLARTLHNMGGVLESLGESDKALPFYEKALAMYRQQTGREIASAPEAQALAFLASLPLSRDGYLCVALHVPGSAAASYLPFWHDRGTIFRLLLRRHESAQVARLKSSQANKKWLQLADVRRRVSRLIVAPGNRPAARDRLLENLEAEQHQLERDLAKLLPELEEHKDLVKLEPKDLADKLPARSAFVDLARYSHWDDAKFTGYRYIAFVIMPGLPAQRVPLGDSADAASIDRAVTSWRQSIERREASSAPARLRKLLWSKVESALPADINTVYLCSEGNLARLPFAALPGRKPGSVLLEDYALASVPSGLWLLHQLRHPGTPLGPDSSVLTVGGVDFGTAPMGGPAHQPLPGTAREVQRVLDAFGLPHDRNLGGASATVAAVLEQLPKAAIAHLATHGEFREEELNREYERIERFHEQMRKRGGWEPSEHGTPRVGLAVENPLAFVGVVLSGGNDQAKAPGGGILTGLQILEQPLQKMRLCVLSACETGLGRYTQGEGVAGLQRAFHVAGCRNVVGSLWKVDDAATAALMAQFYHELRDNKKTPLEALRLAQLTVYRHPERIQDLAGLRGRPAREKAVKLGTAAGPAAGKQKRSEPLLWAAFVLSGAGD